MLFLAFFIRPEASECGYIKPLGYWCRQHEVKKKKPWLWLRHVVSLQTCHVASGKNTVMIDASTASIFLCECIKIFTHEQSKCPSFKNKLVSNEPSNSLAVIFRSAFDGGCCFTSLSRIVNVE